MKKMPFIVERVIFRQPPDALLAHDYVRMKSLKCLDALQKTCHLDHVKDWKSMIIDQIVVVRNDSDFRALNYLEGLFDGKITFEACQTNIFTNVKAVRVNASDNSPSSGTLDSHLVLIVLETDRYEKIISLSSRSEEMLLALRNRCSKAEIRKFWFCAPSVNVRTDKDKLTEAVNRILKLDRSDTLDVSSSNIQTENLYNLVNRHTSLNIERIVKSMQGMMPHIQDKNGTTKDASDCKTSMQTIVKGVQTAIDTFSDLLRVMSPETKENLVTPELQEKFDRMKNIGYAGHVYINKTLTVYVRENSDQKAGEILIKEAGKYFDRVICFHLSTKDTVKQFTLKHDENIRNENGRNGRLGVIARQNHKFVALTVPHLATSGQVISNVYSVIGTCIWPPSEPDFVLMNKISVIEINAEWQNNCNLMHENLNGNMRPFTLHLSKPIPFTKVYKGRLNTGFITGRVISNEAKLPFHDGTLDAYLVEGDDELPFAHSGDSGVVVKLQHEVGGNLHGLSMVFGGALDLPNIEPDTCITIPLAAAVNEFERENETNLLFQ